MYQLKKLTPPKTNKPIGTKIAVNVFTFCSYSACSFSAGVKSLLIFFLFSGFLSKSSITLSVLFLLKTATKAWFLEMLGDGNKTKLSLIPSRLIAAILRTNLSSSFGLIV